MSLEGRDYVLRLTSVLNVQLDFAEPMTKGTDGCGESLSGVMLTSRNMVRGHSCNTDWTQLKSRVILSLIQGGQ